MSSVSRRRFLTLGGSGLAAVGVSAYSLTQAAETVSGAGANWPPTPTPLPTQPPTPTPPPRPIEPRGRETVALLPGSPYQVDGVAIHSGKPGPCVMVLGGVHGNEPGGWFAAEAIADWELTTGSLLVLPRVNWRAAAIVERTLPEIGDINRAYPGNASGTPAQRIAHAIVEAGREFQPELLFDLHESWVFFQERGANSGTAFIGQTVAIGGGANDGTVDRVANVVRMVNDQISPREEFYLRGAATPRPGIQVVPPNNSSGAPRPSATPGNGVTFNGTSSLSLGQWIKGCVPILVEMGQRDQAERRRSQLHQMLVRTTLEQSRMM